MNATIRHAAALAAGVLLGLAPLTRPVAADTGQVVNPDQMERIVKVRDVHATPDGISGVIVNTSDETLSDVRIGIAHHWMWKNEFHPGKDDPSRFDVFTVPGTIPPGGEKPFTVRLDTP